MTEKQKTTCLFSILAMQINITPLLLQFLFITEHFPCVRAFNPLNNLAAGYHSLPHCTDEQTEWHSVKATYLPRVTQLGRGGTRILYQACDP